MSGIPRSGTNFLFVSYFNHNITGSWKGGPIVLQASTIRVGGNIWQTPVTRLV